MAVYTHITQDQLRAFLKLYDIGALISFKGIEAGVENSNYLLITSKGRYILTLYEKRVEAQDVPFFLDLMMHLAGCHLPCPTPVEDRNGVTCQILAGRPAAIISFIKGQETNLIQPQHCDQVGAVLAQLHLAGRDFPMQRPNDLSLNNWHHLAKVVQPGISQEFPGLSALIATTLDHLDTHWPKDLPQGIIHADLFPDNVFFHNEQLVGLIDFYFACTDAYAYDLAICANAWCFDEDQNFVQKRYAALLSGYTSIRPLIDSERNALPWLLQGSALRFLLTRAYDWLYPQDGGLVKAKNPMDYVQRLNHWQKETQ